jgi:hypothetical protein
VAAEAWAAYIRYDAKQLKQYVESNTFWASLHSLKTALEAQIKRLQEKSIK